MDRVARLRRTVRRRRPGRVRRARPRRAPGADRAAGGRDLRGLGARGDDDRAHASRWSPRCGARSPPSRTGCAGRAAGPVRLRSGERDEHARGRSPIRRRAIRASSRRRGMAVERDHAEVICLAARAWPAWRRRSPPSWACPVDRRDRRRRAAGRGPRRPGPADQQGLHVRAARSQADHRLAAVPGPVRPAIRRASDGERRLMTPRDRPRLALARRHRRRRQRRVLRREGEPAEPGACGVRARSLRHPRRDRRRLGDQAPAASPATTG